MPWIVRPKKNSIGAKAKRRQPRNEKNGPMQLSRIVKNSGNSGGFSSSISGPLALVQDAVA